MLYPEGLMHRKVNIGLALLIIVVVAGIFAWIISARAFIPGIGLVVTAPPLKCVLDPDSGTCPNCAICGSLGGVCGGLFEVQVQYYSGFNSLYTGAALCVVNPIPPNGGIFRPGAQCLGLVQGFGPHVLQNFGCFL